jgi:hypothetical protein
VLKTLADRADDCEERFGRLLLLAVEGPLSRAELDELNAVVAELIAMHTALQAPDAGLPLAMMQGSPTRH